MPSTDLNDLDPQSPPFDQFTHVHRLASARSGHASVEHVRHHLFVGRLKRPPTSVLIKLTAKPGLVYQQNLKNEIASLTTINRELPDAPYFPTVIEHGQRRDGRVYLISTLFDEFPLAASIDAERTPARLVGHLRAAIETARALEALHGLDIFHVDLNPMNILYRVEKGNPIIRIVDFESSYERARHTAGETYNPPTTAGYCAPELTQRPPDARADLYSLGAVLYTMLAGYQWTWEADAATSVKADQQIDPELEEILLTAVATDPDQRYPSVAEYRAALSAYLESIWPGRSW